MQSFENTFENYILLLSVNECSLMFNAINLKKFSHGHKFRPVVNSYSFDVGMKLRVSKSKILKYVEFQTYVALNIILCI